MDGAEDRQSGFTLIEVMVSMLLLGLLAAIAVGPWKGFQEARAHKETSQLIVTAMRNAQVSAVAESTRYRVAVTDSGKSLTVYQSPVSGTEVLKTKVNVADRRITLTSPAFTGATPPTSAFFFGRGSATAGRLLITRAGHPDVKVIVEGLTGRVSISG